MVNQNFGKVGLFCTQSPLPRCLQNIETKDAFMEVTRVSHSYPIPFWLLLNFKKVFQTSGPRGSAVQSITKVYPKIIGFLAFLNNVT